MAKIKKAILSFSPSESENTSGYALYFQDVKSADGLSYDSPRIDLGKPEAANGKISVNLSAIEALKDKTGTFNFGVAAYDDSANESDMQVAANIPLALTAPKAPAELLVSFV